MSELSALGYDISRYFVRQILDSLGLRERSFYKDLPMKDVKDRNEQFEQITAICEEASSVGLPIVSIDTKKKEMLGNFKHEGRLCPMVLSSLLTTTSPHSLMGRLSRMASTTCPGMSAI